MKPTRRSTLLILLHWLIFACHATGPANILPGDCAEKYCYDLDIIKPQLTEMGTKSMYPRYTDFDVNQEFTIPNCTPTKLWILIRHGARTPTKAELQKFNERLPNVHKKFLKAYSNRKLNRERDKCRMCDLDVELLKNWPWLKNLSQIEPNQLLPKGADDLTNMAKNLRKMFPTLFVDKYSEEDYLFLSARESRTRHSYYAFVEGLFGENAHLRIRRRKSKDDDMLLMGYNNCKASVKNSNNLDLSDQEPAKFAQLPAYKQMIRDVSFRLGYDTPINASLFRQIWDMCSYEQSWSSIQPSPWCVVFTPSHYKLLDYREDISYYYKKSYGSKVNLKLACPTINDMLYHIDNYDSYKVVGYFIHSTLLQLFLTALGVFKDDEDLRADNFERMQNRKFRSAFTLPLTSNIGLVKYDCPLEPEREQILFMLNQKPMRMEWCDHNDGLCPLTAVKMQYAKYAALDCEESFCDANFQGFDEDAVVTKSFGIACRSLNILYTIPVTIIIWIINIRRSLSW